MGDSDDDDNDGDEYPVDDLAKREVPPQEIKFTFKLKLDLVSEYKIISSCLTTVCLQTHTRLSDINDKMN